MVNVVQNKVAPALAAANDCNPQATTESFGRCTAHVTLSPSSDGSDEGRAAASTHESAA